MGEENIELQGATNAQPDPMPAVVISPSLCWEGNESRNGEGGEGGHRAWRGGRGSPKPPKPLLAMGTCRARDPSQSHQKASGRCRPHRRKHIYRATPDNFQGFAL